MAFTLEADPIVEQSIQRQLDTIVQMILQRLNNPPEGIVLCGAFGHGEGTVLRDGGLVRPVNDYDILVVTEDASLDGKKLGSEIARALGMRLVDIGFLRLSALNSLPATQLAYDLRRGSFVIYGHQGLLKLIPDFPAERIPLWDVIKLLCNRMAGILGGCTERSLSGSALERDCWKRVQIDHMLIACGDSLLIMSHLYHHRYEERLKRLRLVGDQWLGENELKSVTGAYQRKLSVWTRELADAGNSLEKMLTDLCPLVEKVYVKSMEAYSGKDLSGLGAAILSYLHARSFSGWKRLRYQILRLLRMDQNDKFNRVPASPVDIAYTLIPPCYFGGSWQSSQVKREKMIELLRNFVPCRGGESDSKYYEEMSKHAYLFWEEHCH